MTLIKNLILSSFIVSCLFSLHAKENKNDWVNLLEGDSLKLWEPGPSKSKAESIGDRWSLKDGIIHLDRDAKEGRGGQIWTKKSYYDFELKFEFNIAYNGNSGIKYRSVNADGRALGCEYQIIDDVNYRDNKNPTHRTACLYELVAVPSDRLWNPAGQWNTGRIIVSNNLIEHWLNGVKVVSIKMGSDDWKQRFANSKYKVHPDFAKKAGPIVLTDHQDTVSYKNLFIREIKNPTKKSASVAQPTPSNSKKKSSEPLAFTTNCKACHLLDQVQVGPSLVEIAELYPKKNLKQFVKWCLKPGRKRDQMPQMPSMAHIPESQLIEIYDYIKTVTIGVKKVKASKIDPYATASMKTKRPRVERTFVPESGPASVIVALPTTHKHNIIWDTDSCRLRYISVGEIDNYPYLRSNGNSLAKVGDIIYRESNPIFIADRPQYLGYHLSQQGFPSFVYLVGNTKVTETITVKSGLLVRSFKSDLTFPNYQLPDMTSDKITISKSQSPKSLILSYTAK